MSTPSSSDDRPGGDEPGSGAGPDGGYARDDARAQGEPAAGARPEDAGGAEDPFIAEEPEDEDPRDAEEAAGAGDDEESGTAAAYGRPGRGGGAFGAETCAVAALLAVGGALVGPRLVQMLSSVTAQDQVSAIARTIVGDGVVALIGVVLGLLGLGLADERSRPWARWAAGAAVILGILFAVVSVVAYLLVPAPAPAPMGPQM